MKGRPHAVYTMRLCPSVASCHKVRTWAPLYEVHLAPEIRLPVLLLAAADIEVPLITTSDT